MVPRHTHPHGIEWSRSYETRHYIGGQSKDSSNDGHYPPLYPAGTGGNLRENDGMVEGEGRPFFTTETSLIF